MNELQEVADGDLTIEATVSEDITGAIADSVESYTVEELRGLVGRVTNTAEQVTAASNTAQNISTELLEASQKQSRDIQETGQAVLEMAVQITDVSKSANESAEVARQSGDGGGTRFARGGKCDQGHERNPRANPGNLEADQASG